MIEREALAFSEVTQNLLRPIRLTSSDRIWIGMHDDKGDFFEIRMFGTDGAYTSAAAVGAWVDRLQECTILPGNVYKISATDFNVSIIYALWKDKIKFDDQIVELHFKKWLLFVYNGNEQARQFKRYKAGLDVEKWEYPDKSGLELARHQRFAYVNSCATDGYGFFMEQGTGKTASAIAVVCKTAMRLEAESRLKRIIVVCPNNVRLNWQVEMEKFSTVENQVTVLRGTKKQRIERLLKSFIPQDSKNEVCVVVVGYDTLKNSWDYISKIQWDVAIADESHYFKTPSNQRSKVMMKLRDKSNKRLVLTGTPITNTALDLYNQFEFMGRNYSGFTSFKAFKKFYGVYVTGESGFDKLVGLQNQAFMQERMARLCFIVRKDEALPDLPSKVYDVAEVQMTKEQREIYDKVATQLNLEIEHDLASASGNAANLVVNNILTKLLKLAQITSGFVVFPEMIDEDGNVEQARSIKRLKENPKLDKLVELLKAKEPTSKSLVWACWVEDIQTITARLEQEGINAVTYYGATSFADRVSAVDKFNKDPSTTVFISNPAAGGTGITLLGHDPMEPDKYETNCDQEFYYSQNWSMVHRSQSEDRPHRHGTRVPITITDLCVPETIDEEIRARVLDKITTALELGDLRKVLSKVL